MRPAAALVPFFTLLAAIGGLATGYTRTTPQAPAEAGPAPQVKLAVLVVFDQMRGDYPEKWRPLFGQGGFARLQSEGAWFTRCYYPYGTTTTGPGHASILTGTCPDRHGIINNEWFQRKYPDAEAVKVNCVSPDVEDRYAVVPAAKAEKGKKAKAGSTPERLLSETVADVLKVSRPRAKVFGLSLKDRSAILPTGRHPDGAFWFDGRFVTSTYYNRPLPRWAAAFDQSGTADRWFGKDWVRFRPDLDYAAFSGPDDAPGEGVGIKQGKTFPHPMTGGLKAPGKEYYEALANSPFGNELLLAFAKACIRAEELGKDDVPDLLVLSFSSNDLIGHTWGPDSQEVLDVTLRSDALMADLLRFLDATVGKGSYLLAVTADHGICPLPEVAAAHGHPGAKRVSRLALQEVAESHLRATFGSGTTADPRAKSAWIEQFAVPWVYLNPRLLHATGRSRSEVARSLADHLMTQPDVARAFTRDELAGEFPAHDEIGRRAKRAFHPDRSGDVYVVLRPFDLFSERKPGETGKADTGTTHGTPHGYDAYVPLMVLGPGIGGGPRAEPVTPQAAAAIFARFLGVRPPAGAEFPVPATLSDFRLKISD